VYDAFLYNGEADILETRLRETEGVVDKWVIVECTHTHQGNQKPRTLREQMSPRFSRWAKKIEHSLVPPRGANTGERERSQREDVGTALIRAGVNPQDVVHTSDCDEITSGDALKLFVAGLATGHFSPNELYSPEHRMAYYWFNCQSGTWGAAKLGTWLGYAARAGTNVHAARFLQTPTIPASGWHLSFMGSPVEVADKLESYLHEELNQPNYKDERHVRICRSTGIDLFLRAGIRYLFVPGQYPNVPRHLTPELRRRHVADAEFNELWITDHQLMCMAWTYGRVRELKGRVLELGCWEGRSSVTLAQAAYPDVVEFVDTWGGDMNDGSPNGHRDVWEIFKRNVNSLTLGNYKVTREAHDEFLAKLGTEPVKFAHLDGNHHHDHVARQIAALKPLVPLGGVLCGDDFQSASAQRADLGGGVERAVRDLLPGFEQINNLWIWQRRE
jgi:beta-1,4-mannosyl-glycoprotein beta-1,4-N-acetylglucosaminyltransferase